jgi:hypothetical protein
VLKLAAALKGASKLAHSKKAPAYEFMILPMKESRMYLKDSRASSWRRACATLTAGSWKTLTGSGHDMEC